MIDMNASRLHHDSDGLGPRLVDPRVTSGSVTCHFRGIKEALIGYIWRYECVAGCVAWLTEPDILRALATRREATIIVQKEDFLRPDANGACHDLHDLYGALKGSDRYRFPGVLSTMSCAGDPTIEGVRCVGNHNRDRDPAFPRAHHKFLVFGHCETDEPECACEPNEFGECDYEKVEVFTPDAVWTGSYNLTVNADCSLENGVFINDVAVARAYLIEFEQVAALSEPLDWHDRWMAPEWRIGT